MKPIQKKKESSKPIPKIASSGTPNPIFLLLGVVLIVFVAYLPLLKNGFVNWDDDKYILNNPLLQSINLHTIFSSYTMGNYHPVTMLVYAIEYQLFGFSETGYHTVSLLLHLFNVLLVYRVVFLFSEKMEVALIASLLFGVHPIQVESVAWASELKDMLYTSFYLLSYSCYLKYLKDLNKKFYFYALAFFLLSLLSLAMAASLPLLLMLTDYYKGRKLSTKVVVEKLPFLLLSLVLGMVAIVAQQSVHATEGVLFSLPQRIVFASYGFVTYLLTFALPLHLSAFYPYPINSNEAIPASYYVYPLLIIGLVCGVVYSLRFSKKIIFGLGFFAATVLLVLQLLPVGNAIMADRYAYIPSIGIFYLVAEGFYQLWTNQKKALAGILTVAFVIFFFFETYTRCSVWKDSLSLWSDLIDKYPNVHLAYYNRAAILKSDGKNQEALDDYNKAIELRPDLGEIFTNRGGLLMNLNKLDEAMSDFNKAIELKSDIPETYNNRGILFLYKKDYEASLKDFNKAIELQPKFADAYYDRGIVLMVQNKLDDAIADYSKAIAIQPNYAKAYTNRGISILNQKKYAAAIPDFDKAISLQPDLAEAYYNKGIAEYSIGKKDAACLDFKQATLFGYKQADDSYKELCR